MKNKKHLFYDIRLKLHYKFNGWIEKQFAKRFPDVYNLQFMEMSRFVIKEKTAEPITCKQQIIIPMAYVNEIPSDHIARELAKRFENQIVNCMEITRRDEPHLESVAYIGEIKLIPVDKYVYREEDHEQIV